ncbi:hypothetical protein Zmor_026650 [Zophobas morio]|uniref:Odorant receptor n=1 Tax=Zophobas morio TaxID=2755281 RepID=A0AA38M597_9CUCU|nr:hypothetical protein Zmor_026650 [Zophobas morio]
MSNIITKSFRINLFIMKLCHLYPPEKRTTLFKIRAYLIQILFVVPVPVLGIIYLLTEKNLDVEKANYNAGFLAQATCLIAKLFPFIRNGDRIKGCIMYFETYCVPLKKQSQKNIINDCVNVCRRNTFIFLFCVTGGVTSWATRPLFWDGRNLPVDLWLPFNPYENWFVYSCVYVYVTVGELFSSLVTGILDPLIAGLAYHATGQIKILKDNLEHLLEFDNEKLTVNEMTKNVLIYNRIKRCVVHHNATLSFIKEFEECFSPVVFSQFAGSVFVICFCCLQMSKVSSEGFYFMQLVMYFSVILAQLYFYCYYGSTLFEESNNLTNAIYIGRWYDYDTKSKKALITLMERSREPITVTAGKILDLSLATFATILRRSYSLLAVLKNYE